jgi:hypothetical protein
MRRGIIYWTLGTNIICKNQQLYNNSAQKELKEADVI